MGPNFFLNRELTVFFSFTINPSDRLLEELRTEMAVLVKLNLTTGIDAEIYGEEYNRITCEIEDLRSKRAGVSQAEMMRQETLGTVREIAGCCGK